MFSWPDISSLIAAVAILGLYWFFFYRRDKMQDGRCKSQATLYGKTVIITGANTGIGKETARDLARRGARVILACRSIERGMEAAEDIEPDSRGTVIVRLLDLASLESIRNFVKQINSSEDRVDILINNAGVFCAKATTEDGFDMQFGVNHLGHFLLTLLLLDKLKSSAPARIVNVSSRLHARGVMHWDDLHLEKPDSYGPIKAYSQSKLANVLFTRELARRLKGTNVNSYALHPGGVRTKMDRNFSDVFPSFLTKMYSAAKYCLPFIWKTCEEGAQTTIYCAVAEELANQSGLYYSDCKICEVAPQAIDNEAASRLWDISFEMTKIKNQVEDF